MAMISMKKLTAVVPKKSVCVLMRTLQKRKCIEFLPSSEHFENERKKLQKKQAEELTQKLDTAKRAVAFLTKYTDVNSFELRPPDINADDFDLGLDKALSEKAEFFISTENRIAVLTNEIKETRENIDALIPFKNTEFPLPQFRTEHTFSVSGSIPALVDTDVIREELRELACTVSLIHRDRHFSVIFVCSHSEHTDKVLEIITSAGFTETKASASKENGFAAGEIEKLKNVLIKKEAELADLKKTVSKESIYLTQLKALCDIYRARLERLNALEMTAETSSTVIICGWVPVSAQRQTANLLHRLGCAWSFEDPIEGEDVPVLLENRGLASDFQPIMTMYSLPAYKSFDPTVIMSFFYILIFGLMFADVGYGILLFTGCFLFLRFRRKNGEMKHMLKMFMYCSFSCIFFGALLGGYFGDLPAAVSRNFMGIESGSPALWFDMVKDPIRFFILSLGVGVLHIVTGMIIKFYILCRDGYVFSAFADIGSWLLVFSGIGLYFINGTIGIITVAAGILILITTQGRNEKKLIMKILRGFMSLYGIVNYASDILSYSRILALSLSSAIIASVVNTIATMTGPSLGGVILFISVFTAGHALNIAVNLLGAYVHTSRLQYLEFFGKFFRGEGKEFSPLDYKSEYVNLK